MEHNYWIEYTNGTRSTFYAEDAQDADWYFRMEGDHAYTYGAIDNK